VAVSPSRITDTRAGSGQANAGSTLTAGSTLSVQVTGAGGVPTTGVSGVVLNATVTNTTGSSFLTAWPTGGTMPTVSNLNWVAGWTVPNRVIVPVGTGGKVNFYNKFGSTDLIVDVDGYYTDATAAGKFFTPMTPNRVIDTRLQGGTLGAGQSSTYAVAGFAGVPSGATGVIFNVTVTNTTSASFLTVYPNARPLSSDLNWVAGQTIPNMTQATLSSTGTVSFYNNGGSTDLVVDLSGFFGQAGGVTVAAAKTSIPADGVATSGLTVTVTDSTGSPVFGDPVNFTTSGSAAGVCGTVTGSTSTTNSAGQVTATYTAGTTAGTCTITATEAFKTQSGSVAITQTTVPNTVTITFGSNAIPASTSTVASTTSVTVNVKTGVAPITNVSGDAVTLTMSGSPATACGSLTASSGTTDGSGNVAVTYTASSSTGFCTITAKEAQTGTSASKTLTQTTNPAQVGNKVSTSPPNATMNADGKTTQVVTATVTTATNTAISGDPVMFTLTASPNTAGVCGTLNTAFGTTNGSGQTSVTYTSGSAAGTCTIDAQEANGGAATPAAGTDTVITENQVPNTITVTANPTTLPADGTSTSTVTITVTNAVTGAAVANDALTISKAGTPCGTLGTASGSPAGNTDTSGKVTLSYKAGTAVGFCTITAKDSTNATGGSTTITQTTPAAPSVTVTVSPSSVVADGAKNSTVTAVVKSSGGGAVNNDPVIFTLSGSPAAACGTLGPSSGTPAGNTDTSGTVTATYTASATAGTCTVTALEASAGASGSAAITQTKAPNTITLTFGANAIPASTSSTASTTSVTANVKTGTVSPAPANVVGDAVTFTMSGSSSVACGTLSASSGTTDNNGNVAVTYTASTNSGFCTVTATEAGTGSSVSKTLDQTTNPAPPAPPGVGANTVAATNNAPGGGIPANGTTQVTITAVAKTALAAGISGDTLRFTVSGSNCGTVSPTYATTDGTGTATATYTAAATGVAGACTVTAQEAFGAATGTTSITQNQVNNAISFTSSNSQVSSSGSGTSSLVVTVTNAVTGAAVSGDAVTFTFVANPAGACNTTLTNVTPASSATDTNGKVTATYTASLTPGFCTITAHEAGTTQTASVTIQQTP
jgi:adhesin/invasin